MLEALIVEDDPSSLELLADLVEKEGYRTRKATTLADARKAVAAAEPDVVLLDLRLPDGDGLEILEEIEGLSTTPDIVVMTGHASVQSAVEALRQGVSDYLTKPLDVPRLQTMLATLARTRDLKEEIVSLRQELRDYGRFGALIGSSPPMQDVYNLIEKVAPTNATVFLAGESGTGKEVAAQTLHNLSRRRRGPFLPLNCGAISPNLIESELFGHERGSFTGATRAHKGAFERADGGTIFLDEITEMPIELQVKLLRVLETSTVARIGGERPVKIDTRVIAATNRRPEEAVADDKLRQDLFYRLQVFPIQLPPLRERGDDVEILSRHFVHQFSKEYDLRKSLGKGALECLQRYSWPGNVRELKNVLNRAFIVAEDEIVAHSLPAKICGEDAEARSEVFAETTNGAAVTLPVGTSLAGAEKQLILAALEKCRGDKKQAAKSLGISIRTLYNRLKEYEAEKKGV